MTLMFVILVIGVVIGLFVTIYNKLIKQRNLVQEGWSDIDVQLKRRSDLIPNLLETVKGYMTHERTVFEEVTQARAQTLKAKDVPSRAQSENSLSGALGNLFAVAENYPELKANANFLDLQKTLTDLEEQIQYSRRFYNGTVRDYNITIQSFPSNIIASVFGFGSAQFFELENKADANVPKISFS